MCTPNLDAVFGISSMVTAAVVELQLTPVAVGYHSAL
jgi:hypothetical protein